MDTVLECSVCLDSLPPDSGECEVTDYVAHYCGLACYVRWHQHEVPLFAYVLEGELTVDYGIKGKKTYHAGEAVLEAVGWPHNGTNTGAVPMKLVAVYMGSDTATNTVKVPPP